MITHKVVGLSYVHQWSDDADDCAGIATFRLIVSALLWDFSLYRNEGKDVLSNSKKSL